MKEGSHKKVQKIRMVQPTCLSKKKFRWIARGRTWSSSPSSAGTSSKHEGAVPQKNSENKNG